MSEAASMAASAASLMRVSCFMRVGLADFAADAVDDLERFGARGLRVTPRYGVEHGAVKGKGSFGEMRQLQRVLPELVHQVAHRLDDLGEERIARRLDDRLMIFPVLLRGIALGMRGFHAQQRLLDHGDTLARG